MANSGSLLWSTAAEEREIVELVVNSGVAVTTCPPWFWADALVIRELSPRKLVEASGHALRYCGVRELDLSVAARQVRVKFVVTDVMYPVLSVAKLTEQGFKVEFGQQACCIRWRLCGTTPTIWDILDTDGEVCREVVNREPCYTIGDESQQVSWRSLTCKPVNAPDTWAQDG